MSSTEPPAKRLRRAPKTSVNTFSDIQPQLRDFFYDDDSYPMMNMVFKRIEEKTTIEREKVRIIFF